MRRLFAKWFTSFREQSSQIISTLYCYDMRYMISNDQERLHALFGQP